MQQCVPYGHKEPHEVSREKLESLLRTHVKTFPASGGKHDSRTDYDEELSRVPISSSSKGVTGNVGVARGRDPSKCELGLW